MRLSVHPTRWHLSLPVYAGAVCLVLLIWLAPKSAWAKEFKDPYNAQQRPVMAAAFSLEGPVKRVIDGDTLDLIDRKLGVVRVRLAAIDAPEKAHVVSERTATEGQTRQRAFAAQAYSDEALQSLQRLIARQTVRAQCPQWEQRQAPPRGRDAQARARAICWVWRADTLVNEAQVQMGSAWVYRSFLRQHPIDLQTRLLKAEKNAQNARRGLWAHAADAPVPPWRWRSQWRQN